MAYKKVKNLKIQDGGGRHLGFRKMLIISARMKQFSPNFNSIYLVPASIDPIGQICNFSKIQDGGCRHLGFRKMLIISAWIKQFSPNFNSVYMVPASIDP
jgi:hypothetical protein